MTPAATTTPLPTPLASAPPKWGSEAAWKLPGWAEPIIVASILFGACYYTRRRRFAVLAGQSSYKPLLGRPAPAAPSPGQGQDDYDDDADIDDDADTDDDVDYPECLTAKNPPKRRSCCGTTVLTPNTSRFRSNWHSRVLYKFPFLVEMFYWIVTYAIYRLTHVLSQALFSSEIWDLAQDNAFRVLMLEQYSPVSFLFPLPEIAVQRWFLAGHPHLLTVLNKAYALIHIPGTVYFVAWYYVAAPNHAAFAVVRRTMTLCNLLAFAVFTAYPCMPPRLLPREFGFVDTVRRDDAESVWMSGKFVNHLAAMPSMHFGYAFIIGVTCAYHACVSDATAASASASTAAAMTGWQRWRRWALCAFGVFYPLSVLTIIIATANHYWLDVLVAIATASVALACNRVFVVFVPLEDLLLWALRVDKPTPNCGPAARA